VKEENTYLVDNSKPEKGEVGKIKGDVVGGKRCEGRSHPEEELRRTDG